MGFPPVSEAKELTSNDKKLDVGLKYAAGLCAAAKYDPEYVMLMDADDFVGNDVVDYCAKHPGENGWYICKGYQMLRDRYGKLSNFNERCGTCNIFRFSILMKHLDTSRINAEDRNTILSTVDNYFLRFILGSHKYAPEFFAKQNTPMKPFPKRAAMWLLDHGENRGGNRAEKISVWRMSRLNDKMREYFNLSPSEDGMKTR